jgi:hypothetical protein
MYEKDKLITKKEDMDWNNSLFNKINYKKNK